MVQGLGHSGSARARTRSIGDVLDQSRGLGAGFDFLRVALAFSVIAWHTATIARNDSWQNTAHFLWIFDYIVLQAFFALSGFLIAGSAMRLSLQNFLINRSLRIVPALAVEIVLCALIIGPIFTSVPLHSYFSDLHFFRYFTNIIGLINYYLPGVFTSNPSPRVNGSLWTVPIEIGCYIIMAIFISYNVLKRPNLIIGLAAAALGVGLVMMAVGYDGKPQSYAMAVMDYLFYERGSKLFVSFALGIVAYLYRHKIPYSWPLFLVCVAYIVALAGVIHAHYPFPIINLITVVPVVYILTFLGVTRIPSLPLFSWGDYSYGIYLYGWPVMQVVRTLVPSYGQSTVLLFAVTVPLVTGFAMLSWHFVEKPVLRQRKKFSFVARQRLAEAPPDPALAGSALNDQPLPERG